jgi:hypothetical protein
MRLRQEENEKRWIGLKGEESIQERMSRGR